MATEGNGDEVRDAPAHVQVCAFIIRAIVLADSDGPTTFGDLVGRGSFE
jgi:hypothetical protein